MTRVEYVEIYPALLKWCKQRRYKIHCVNRDVYRVSKRGVLLLTIIMKGDECTLKYGENEEKSCYKVFLKYLNDEIEKVKFLEKLKRQSRPVHTFVPKMVRTKMSTMGVEKLRERGHQMNRRFLGLPYQREED